MDETKRCPFCAERTEMMDPPFTGHASDCDLVREHATMEAEAARDARETATRLLLGEALALIEELRPFPPPTDLLNRIRENLR